ncbi:MAG: clostripain-related cysteine peptidase [Candidatus Krumholzibacteriia bacterium]
MKTWIWFLVLATALLALSLGCSSDDPVTDPPAPPPSGTTALVGDDGAEATAFASFEQVSMSLADLAPNTLYTIEVSDGSRAVIGRYQLLTDGDGAMDASSVLYDPAPGSYDVDVLGTDVSFTITVTAPTDVFYMPCTAGGEHLNTVTAGEPVALTAGNGVPGTTVQVYVVPNRYDWAFGMFLFDYTDAVEELTFDAQGEIPPTVIWGAAANQESVAWDVVIDVNRNGVYDAGDYLDGRLGVGFVVQDADPGKVLIDGHVVERLSSDVNYVYRDLFDVGDNVYVYLNPVARLRDLGANRYVKWFIVPHQATWNDQDPLNPVETPLGDTVQYGCTNAGRRLVWPGPLVPGQYDIVLDVDGDELYDKGQDILDGYSGPGDWVGFTVQATPETRDWTLLVYADGEGGLSGSRSQYANEIAAAMDDDMYAGVLFDGDDAAGYTDCKRYVVTPGAVTTDADYGELNMGQALTLQDFLTWGIARFPAHRYMIVLSNHGGSWFGESHAVPNELDYDEPGKAMCYDNGDALNLYELERVYRDVKAMVGGKLDVIWYQGCLMGGVEVAAVSKDYFAHMVSHETVRYGGENTNKFSNVVQFLRSNPTAEDAAAKCVTAESAPSSSLSASYDLSEYGDLEHGIRAFVDAALGSPEWDTFKGEFLPILTAVRRTGPPANDLEPYMQNGDLADFFSRVSEASEGNIPESVRGAATAIEVQAAFLVGTVMGNTGGPEGLNGTAIWLPRTAAEFNTYAAEYAGFDFASNTRWLEFLAELYGVAYRIELTWGAEPRDLDSHLYDANGNHLYYGHREIPGANLDTDDVTGFGPENVRISYLAEGPVDHYEYKVYLYSGNDATGEISTVKVFRGGSAAPVHSWSRSWSGIRWWHVFNIMTADGSIVEVDSSSKALAGDGSEAFPIK